MKKIGVSYNGNLQGDSLIVNNGETASVQFNYTGGSDLVFQLPLVDGSAGFAIITDGLGNLSFGTVSTGGGTAGSGTIDGGGSTPMIPYFTGSYSLADSDLKQGTGQLLFPSGSTSSPGISFIADSDTGLLRSGVNELSIISGGVDAATFKSTGVVIGDVTYTRTDGVAGYVLTTDGLGNTSWIDNAIGIQGVTGATGSQGENGATGSQGATGSIDNQFMYQSNVIVGASFSGVPSYYDVSFVGSFTASYVVSLDSEEPRDWTIKNKTITGFRVESNSSTGFTHSVYWNAIENSNITLGAFVGAQGPAGSTGNTGATGSQGATGATGSQGVEGPAFTPTNTTGVVIAFTSSMIYNSPSSPGTASITDNLSGANIGIIQKVYHNYSSLSVPGTWTKLGQGTYSVSNLNIIYAEWVTGTRVEYWIVN